MKSKYMGLTLEEVNERISKNLVNNNEEPQTKTIKEIIKGNVFTYFNFLNIFLGFLVILSGIISGSIFSSLKNCLFMGVIFTNTIISTVEEILAKKTIDKLNVLSSAKIDVIRNGNVIKLSKEEIVLDDICIYSIGNQVVADSILLEGTVEVNESFITGEEKIVTKKKDDEIISGSFIVSGKAYVKVKNVGANNYVAKITKETKYIKKTNSVIYNSFEKMLKILSALLIPIGILFFISQFGITKNISESLLNTVGALIGMIPEGLVLLTSSAMAVSVLRLKKYHILVQDLYSIENLARVDVLCLDKTGTITEGIMEVKKILPYKNYSEEKILKILKNYCNALDDPSPTFKAIESFAGKEETFKVNDILYFSSIRKYSGVKFEEGCYLLGSPENISNKKYDFLREYEEDNRIIMLAKVNNLKDYTSASPLGFILIQDKIKKNASETLNYLKDEGIDIKIISGDNPITVSKIAQRAGINDIKAIDMTNVIDEDIPNVINEYNIFGRVKPSQKRQIIKCLKNENHFVAMTGDGVNDALALKEADCSIAMANGSEAAKNISQFVLLDSSIDNLPKILKEGRRSINNIERSSSLLLSKTLFTIILILICLIFNTEYFFIPIHLTLITMFTIGIPSFILALEPNNEIVKGNFLLKVFLKSLPSALTVVFNVVIIRMFQVQFNLDMGLCSTLTVFLTAITGFIYLNYICKPYNLLRGVMMCVLFLTFEYCALFQYKFFNISEINKDTILIFIVLFICSIYIFDKLKNISNYILKKTKNV
ncbi:MAG: HAD-IC family P-type ATPase [Bacilli bacterium]